MDTLTKNRSQFQNNNFFFCSGIINLLLDGLAYKRKKEKDCHLQTHWKVDKNTITQVNIGKLMQNSEKTALLAKMADVRLFALIVAIVLSYFNQTAASKRANDNFKGQFQQGIPYEMQQQSAAKNTSIRRNEKACDQNPHKAEVFKRKGTILLQFKCYI